jgi:hypothetical protein
LRDIVCAAALNADHDLCSDGTGWGQNLYYGGGTGYDTPGDAIGWWYNSEFSNYDTYGDAALIDIEATPPVYAPPPATPGAVYGHFTQTVWQVCYLSGRPGVAYGPTCRLTYTDAGKCRTQQLLVATPPLVMISPMAMEELSPAHTLPAISIRQVNYFPSSRSLYDGRFCHLADNLTNLVFRQLGYQ